jgi:hypothetical protein
MYLKIKDENPSIKSTRQMRTWENTTQKQKKIKKKWTKNKEKKSYVIRTLGYEMTINNNKEDLRQKKRQSFVTNRPMMKVH